MTHDDKRIAGMAAAGLLEPYDYMHLVKRPRVKRRRRPSFARMAKLARKLGLDVEVSREGVMTLKASQPGSKSAADNPWDEVL